MDIVKFAQSTHANYIEYIIAVYTWLQARGRAAANTLSACDCDEYNRPISYSFDLSCCDRSLAAEFKLKWL